MTTHAPEVHDQHAPSFSADELENSRLLDISLEMDGPEGWELVAALDEVVSAYEAETAPRKRELKPDAKAARMHTLSVLIANLARLSLNRVDPTRFLAVSFNSNNYKASLSVVSLKLIREALFANGLIEGVMGFRKIDPYEQARQLTRLSRMRATPALVQLIRDLGIEFSSIKRNIEANALPPRDPYADYGPMPDEVAKNENVLKAVNARLATSKIALPDASWVRIKGRNKLKVEDEEFDPLAADAGDLLAKSLRRSFNGTWEEGGRIYGGWWMQVPATERRNITINDEPTVEWDYSQLHPAMLFHRQGRVLDFDVYSLPEVEGDGLRQLGKVTFQRLLKAREPEKMRAGKGNKDLLPEGLKFSAYVELYIAHVADIAPFFGTEPYLQLHREDSDLALNSRG